MTTPHLTNNQFTDCVLQEFSPETQAHLAECTPCRQELARFTESLNNFATATLAWSKSQPTVSLRAAARSSARRPVYAAAGWALGAGLVLSIGVPFVWHRDHPRTAKTVIQAASEDTEAQIAEDNQMMQSVDGAIQVHEPSPFTEYRLTEVRRNVPRPRTDLRSE